MNELIKNLGVIVLIIGAAVLAVPFFTGGMTNSILSRWATKIGTGAPLENYNYPPSRSEYVGVPIGDAFRPKTPAEQIDQYRADRADRCNIKHSVPGGAAERTHHPV